MFFLQTKIRDKNKKSLAELRKKGFLPAVLYGPKIKNQSIFVNYKDFEKAYKEAGESRLIKLKLDKKEFQVLIHDTQIHPLSGEFVHADFYQPELKEKVEVSVPLIFQGSSPAEKNLGGIIVKNITEIEIKGLPQELPKEILVDLSELKSLNDNILVKDLQLSPGIEILREPEEVIVSVSAPREEEELEKEEVSAPEEEEIKEAEESEKKEE